MTFSNPVSVKPSLGITCTVHESYVTPRSSGKNLLLSLEIENLCSVCAMCLHTYMCNVFSLSLSPVCMYVCTYVCMHTSNFYVWWCANKLIVKYIILCMIVVYVGVYGI